MRVKRQTIREPRIIFLQNDILDRKLLRATALTRG
jgi:hypothetical protein